MDSRTVHRILRRLDTAKINEIDGALSWLVHQQRALLKNWDTDAYHWSCAAIDDLLDARLARMDRDTVSDG